MDFIQVGCKENKDGTREFYPALQAIESTDLVIRGGQFVAIYDETTGLYNRKLSHMPTIIDRAFAKMVGDQLRTGDAIKKVRNFDNQIYSRLMAMIRSLGDMGPELDQRIIFADEVPTKEHAASFKMSYALSDAPCPVWDELMATLYSPEERLKIEWAIGSVFTGAAADEVQKFYVFFGPPGSGKSTVLNIIEALFEKYVSHFSAFDMGKADSQFSLEPFAKNPLVAIDQDADLSRLEVNKNLNSVVSHDKVVINMKGKNLFEIKPRSTLFIGTNEPIKISNRKSGLFRRLVDIQPTGARIPEEHYHHLMKAVMFELGAIATRCINVFNEYGPTYLSSYRSNDMMYRTNDIFNFVQDRRVILEKGVSLKQAHKMYMDWCEETETRNVYKQYQFRDVLADYFEEFHDQIMVDGQRFRSYFTGLKELDGFTVTVAAAGDESWLDLKSEKSLLDDILADQPAQLASEAGTPTKSWVNVKTKLSDIDTSREHFVLVPTQHIVIDFDLTDEEGNKSRERNLEAAAAWPPTYAEFSRGGGGLHLHYEYDGDVTLLASRMPDSDGIEIKTLLGNSSLRRRVSLCNNVQVATISSGLPLKEKKVISAKAMSGEKSLRDLIKRALAKEINPGTKSNMDFIKKVLDDAEKQGMTYDVSDMWDQILQFAMNSSNQRDKCLEIALGLKLMSDDDPQEVFAEETVDDEEKPIAVFDCEVYPNLFTIGWIYEDAPDDQLVTMVNPTPQEVQELMDRTRLIGFNNRGYDNHILWARTLGYTNEQLYELSQRIIVDKDRQAMFGAAYNATYADLYDILSEKQTLKKWQIDLGLPHMEMDIPWNEPVKEEDVPRVLEYMGNDVLSTRALLRARKGDFIARKILADLSGLQVINTNRQHTERLIFGTAKDTQKDLVYTDLSEQFPGYTFDRFAPAKDKSTYRGESVGEGGLVRSKPGIYHNVALLDVASMHPSSIIALNLFGKYTSNFKRLMDLRLALKKKDFKEAISLMPDVKTYVTKPNGDYDVEGAKMLSDALKIVINSVYGLTAASFPNKFKDPRNLDNIVAKRGALFMLDLKAFVEEKGFEVVHIKTDSVKIPGATPELIEEVMEFGKKYGYDFEHEATYEKFCLVNDAVFVALVKSNEDNPTAEPKWKAVGAQFQHPVVFKSLFTKEEIVHQDFVEIKQVNKGAMYLVHPQTGDRQFVGRFGAFIPVLNGRQLLRVDGDSEHAVQGTKNYLWELDELVIEGQIEVDMSYFEDLINEGIRTISQFGSFEEFVS